VAIALKRDQNGFAGGKDTTIVSCWTSRGPAKLAGGVKKHQL
jgi:hypothetical protein